MDNIYELVDNACSKVRNDIACRLEADRIIQEFNYSYINSVPRNGFYNLPNRHCVAHFYLLGQNRYIEMNVTEKYVLNGPIYTSDLHVAYNAQINAGKIIANLKEFINKNYLRLKDIRPSEILEAIPPIIYKEILYGDHQRGSSPPTYHNCRIGVVRWGLV